MAPGSQVVTHLDFFAGGVIIQKDIGGGLGDDGPQSRGPAVERLFLADGAPHIPAGGSLGQVRRLRPEVPDQPQDLEPPETEDQPTNQNRHVLAEVI